MPLDCGARNIPAMKPDLLPPLIEEACVTFAKFKPALMPNCANTQQGPDKRNQRNNFFMIFCFRIIPQSKPSNNHSSSPETVIHGQFHRITQNWYFITVPWYCEEDCQPL